MHRKEKQPGMAYQNGQQTGQGHKRGGSNPCNVPSNSSCHLWWRKEVRDVGWLSSKRIWLNQSKWNNFLIKQKDCLSFLFFFFFCAGVWRHNRADWKLYQRTVLQPQCQILTSRQSNVVPIFLSKSDALPVFLQTSGLRLCAESGHCAWYRALLSPPDRYNHTHRDAHGPRFTPGLEWRRQSVNR